MDPQVTKALSAKRKSRSRSLARIEIPAPVAMNPSPGTELHAVHLIIIYPGIRPAAWSSGSALGCLRLFAGVGGSNPAGGRLFFFFLRLGSSSLGSIGADQPGGGLTVRPLTFSPQRD